jgi:hypothetical protein
MLVLARVDGSSVVGVRVSQRRHAIAKAAWDTGVAEIRKRSEQAIVGRKCTKHNSNQGIPSRALQSLAGQ